MKNFLQLWEETKSQNEFWNPFGGQPRPPTADRVQRHLAAPRAELGQAQAYNKKKKIMQINSYLDKEHQRHLMNRAAKDKDFAAQMPQNYYMQIEGIAALVKASRYFSEAEKVLNAVAKLLPAWNQAAQSTRSSHATASLANFWDKYDMTNLIQTLKHSLENISKFAVQRWSKEVINSIGQDNFQKELKTRVSGVIDQLNKNKSVVPNGYAKDFLGMTTQLWELVQALRQEFSYKDKGVSGTPEYMSPEQAKGIGDEKDHNLPYYMNLWLSLLHRLSPEAITTGNQMVNVNHIQQMVRSLEYSVQEFIRQAYNLVPQIQKDAEDDAYNHKYDQSNQTPWVPTEDSPSTIVR